MASHRTTYIEHIRDRAFSSNQHALHLRAKDQAGTCAITSAKPYVVTWASKNFVGSRIVILGIGGMFRWRVCHRACPKSAAAIDAASEGLCWSWMLSSAGWQYRA